MRIATKFFYALIAASALTVQAGAADDKPKARTIKGTLILFEGQKFGGSSEDITKDRPSLALDFTIGSIAVHPGDQWELCDKPKYKGNCLTLTADEADIGKAVIKSARLLNRPAE